MTESGEETAEESTDGPTDRWAGFERRPLLRALGAGAALSLGGGATAASGEAFDAQDGDADARIDPQFGYPAMDAAEMPGEFDPAHEVELAAAPPAGPGQPPFLYFDPVGLHVEPGAVVQFTFLSPDHTVTAMHPGIGPGPRVPEASPPFSSPVMGPGAAWLYRFEHDGVYDLYCAPHLSYGMVMRVVVGDLAEGDLPEYAQSVEGLPSRDDVAQSLNRMSEANEGCEWPFMMPAGVLGTDALDAMRVQEQGAVPFEAVVEELGYEFRPSEQAPDGNETADGNATTGDGADGNESTGNGTAGNATTASVWTTSF